MSLTDLAGNEDNRKTGNTGQRITESAHINQGLFTLGKVIRSINAGEHRIPYRDSKLTRVLQDSMGGSCQTVMIATVSPSSTFYLESVHTLDYAIQSRRITNTTSINTVQAQQYITSTAKSVYAQPASQKAFKRNEWDSSTKECDARRKSREEKLQAWRLRNQKTAKDIKHKKKVAKAEQKQQQKEEMDDPEWQPSDSDESYGDGFTPPPVTHTTPAIERRVQALMSPMIRKCNVLDDTTQKWLERLEQLMLNNRRKQIMANSSSTSSCMDVDDRPARQSDEQRLEHLEKMIRYDKHDAIFRIRRAKTGIVVDKMTSSTQDAMSHNNISTKRSIHSSNSNSDEVSPCKRARVVAWESEGVLHMADKTPIKSQQRQPLKTLRNNTNLGNGESVAPAKLEQSTIMNTVDAYIVRILNYGDEKELKSLHGIGKKRAETIIQYRDDFEGAYPFDRPKDLRKIGLSDNAVKKLQVMTACADVL